jgi:hypothetical protein
LAARPSFPLDFFRRVKTARKRLADIAAVDARSLTAVALCDVRRSADYEAKFPPAKRWRAAVE